MVDFMDIADTSRWLLERALKTYDDSDDFVNLEVKSTHQAESVSAPNDSILTALVNDETSYTDAATRPFLTQSAEVELYLLATNFLLYVAMVIITTFIAKVYFPDSLKRGTIPNVRRTYNYRRKTEHSEDEEHQSFVSKDEDELEALYSDDEDDNEGGSHESSDEYEQDDPLLSDMSGETANQNRSRVLEFDQTQTNRSQVYKRLLFCTFMLNLTFVTWGALQERMLTRRYPRYTGDYFTYSYFLVFSNRLWTLIFSSFLLWKLKPRLSRSTVIYEYSFPSISNMLSSWCQYEALRYVSFPATTLMKSFKLGPVMLMGKLLGNKNYPMYDYGVALVIGCGVALFMSSTDDLRFSFSTDYLGYEEAASAKWTGVMLLCFFLFFDSFTSQFQSRLFNRHLDLSIVELMFATSAYSTVLSFVTLVHTHELGPALSFVMEHSEIHLHFFTFSICSTIGQLFIFYTIKNFGAVVFTLIMTTRIVLSIALSCILYGHPITPVGYLGLVLVIGAMLYRIKKKAEGQQLIRWQGMDDEKGQELVHEWHEHLDM